ncbi:DUF6082 family protein [Kineosporia rhizophila]|uniref:DUF6082 family protein n=1 Tax=Kineosporia rhizophila TaxID=84633 RepID=UPI001E4150A3|nr:DUF6082 family protein [Kineosporia rhizophila]MCE0540724.1 DUF6082 family protein [Kineosporia rhizophila]
MVDQQNIQGSSKGVRVHFRSWTIAAGTAIVAGSAVSVAASEARKVRCQVTYAARDLQLRLLQQTLADDELRTEIFPGVSRVHVGINGWVMYHQLMLRSGAESWERFEANARELLGTPAGQAYWEAARPRFQHAKTSRFDQRFVRTLQAAAECGSHASMAHARK